MASASPPLNPGRLPRRPLPQPRPQPVHGQLRTQLRATGLAARYGSDSLCARNHLRCQAQVPTTRKGSTSRLITGTPVGYGAGELAKAYELAPAPKGTGTIVLLGAKAYPKLESDLAV